jgi:4-carboxymuconolactone decarboxylase
MMQRLERLGTFLVNESSLKPREQELAILAIARHWHGNFVFTVHSRVAREQGVPDSVIEEIRTGRMPNLTDKREAAVVEIALTAPDADPASDAVFARAIAALGEESLADLLVFLGYYSTVAMAMKLHRVPVPQR